VAVGAAVPQTYRRLADLDPARLALDEHLAEVGLEANNLPAGWPPASSVKS
jgi:hypothetical protein